MTFTATRCACFISIFIFISLLPPAAIPVRAAATTDNNNEKPKYWTMRYDLSYQRTSGNTSIDDLRTSVELNMKKDKNSLNFTASYARGKTEEEISADKTDFVCKYNRLFTKKAYGATFLLYERDRVRDIDRRWQLGPTAGYRFYDTKTLFFSSDAGAIWDETKSVYGDTGNGGTESKLKGLLNIDFYYIPVADLKIEEKIRWTQQSTDFELNSETGVYVPVYKRFFLKVSVIEHYNTRPQQDLEKNDLTLIASLSYLVHF